MNDNYEIMFAYDKVGKTIVDYLRPYIEKCGLKIDINRSSDRHVYLLGESGEYAGTISTEEDSSNFIVYLNGEGTLILSGELKDNIVSGAVAKTNVRDRANLEAFTTFSTKLFEGHTECIEDIYISNIYKATSGFSPRPLNWTWKDINALLITKKEELTPDYTRKFDNLSPNDFMKAIMMEYENPDYMIQKAV
ncbi:MAG: hypothetical protein IKF71_02730 [Bacilli bacterium]|nr:hypothetical protein [Bacilli bacterium]